MGKLYVVDRTIYQSNQLRKGKNLLLNELAIQQILRTIGPRGRAGQEGIGNNHRNNAIPGATRGGKEVGVKTQK